MKKKFSVIVVSTVLSIGCSQGKQEQQPAATDTTLSANDSIDAQLKKAEDLVKDDTTTQEETSF